MSPAKARKAAKKAKGKPARKASKAKSKPKTAARPVAKAAPAKPATAHCAASDPFGDACQNLPRRPSKYCVIHSYLDR